jgi:NADPH-dependent 7-cyano-7-deazaguanine reductase QueF
MSQRSKNVNEEFIVELKLKVKINSFSNHEGFKDDQIDQAIEEFKEQIKEELECKICGEFHQDGFLQSVDFVSFEVESENV